jgi:hypothetical protein
MSENDAVTDAVALMRRISPDLTISALKGRATAM